MIQKLKMTSWDTLCSVLAKTVTVVQCVYMMVLIGEIVLLIHMGVTAECRCRVLTYAGIISGDYSSIVHTKFSVIKIAIFVQSIRSSALP